MIAVYLYQREGGYFLSTTKSQVASRSVVEDDCEDVSRSKG